MGHLKIECQGHKFAFYLHVTFFFFNRFFVLVCGLLQKATEARLRYTMFTPPTVKSPTLASSTLLHYGTQKKLSSLAGAGCHFLYMLKSLVIPPEDLCQNVN